jgi:hypothetical protein
MVLDGSGTGGDRPIRALELFRAGSLDSLLLSGSQVYPSIWSSTLWVRVLNFTDAEKTRVLELRHSASSTWAEATAATEFFRQRGVDTVVVITSDFHTERAQSILDRVSQGKPVYLVTPSPSAFERSADNREARKTWLLESAKRIHWWTYERWVSQPLALGARAEVPWSAVGGDALGNVPALNGPTVTCPPPVVCPPAPKCPACPPCKEAVKRADKPVAKAAAPEKTKPKAKEPAKSDKKAAKKN